MDNVWLSQLTERFRREILMPRLAEFRTRIEELRNQPLESFLEEGGDTLISETHLEFMTLLEAPIGKQLAPEFKQIFFGYLVSGFNSVLSDDFPYIMAIANVRDERQMRFIFMFRVKIAGLYPKLPFTGIPIVFAETLKDVANGRFYDIKIVEHPDDVLIIPLEDQ